MTRKTRSKTPATGSAPAPRKRGRPEWKPHNPEHARLMVERLTGLGTTQSVICSLLDPPCTENTLRAHYADVLEAAVDTLQARVEGTILQLALGRPAVRGKNGKIIEPAIPPDKTMLIFTAKARYGWKDTQKHEHSGPDGAAIPIDIKSLTDAQLAQLCSRLEGSIAAAREAADRTEAAPAATVEPVHQVSQ